jgi:hypothetical protein
MLMMFLGKPGMTATKTKKLTQVEIWKKRSADHFENLHEETKRVRSKKLIELMGHPLFVSYPRSWEDSKNFGWMRGIAMATETFFEAKWHSWLHINKKGELNEDDYVPHYEPGHIFYDPKRPKNTELGHMLHNCLEHVKAEGRGLTELIEWIGYSLGIAWFHKPRLSDKTLQRLYTDFVLELFWIHPADIMSIFVSQHGQSGVLDYFPTPIHITDFMNRILETEDKMSNWNHTAFEPCIGGAAMFLPNKSLNQVGADYNLLMTKVASIQAFIYLPHLLYTPKPILGLHVDKETYTINRYFEFDTNTRLYNGDSLLGEYVAPKDIFQENSEKIDVYFFPADATKVEWYKLEEEFLRTPWEKQPKEFKTKVVVAQSRLIKMQVGITNPPFNASLSKAATQQLRNIHDSNEIFFSDRERRLSDIQSQHALSEMIRQEIEFKLAPVKANKKLKIIENQYAFEL